MQVEYREYPASSTLQPYVECYWSRQSDGSPLEYSALQRCLPLGMSELIFQVGNIHQAGVIDGDGQPFPSAFIEAMMSESVLWQMPGASTIFGVQLKPEGLIQLFRRPLADTVNQHVTAEAFFGNCAKSLTESIQHARNDRERIYIMENFLLLQLMQSRPKPNYFSEAMKKIRCTGGNISVESLSKTLYVCERQLQRAFKVNLGISPKAYQRIIRFRETYHYLNSAQNVSWAEIAHAYSYSDQAHFIRDFKAFSGATPNVVLQEITLEKLALS